MPLSLSNFFSDNKIANLINYYSLIFLASDHIQLQLIYYKSKKRKFRGFFLYLVSIAKPMSKPLFSAFNQFHKQTQFFLQII